MVNRNIARGKVQVKIKTSQKDAVKLVDAFKSGKFKRLNVISAKSQPIDTYYIKAVQAKVQEFRIDHNKETSIHSNYHNIYFLKRKIKEMELRIHRIKIKTRKNERDLLLIKNARSRISKYEKMIEVFNPHAAIADVFDPKELE
jgi:hypothetical protein